MILSAFAVYDSKAEGFLPPFFLPTQAMALRAFQGAANDPTHDFHKWAGDYTLYEIGTFQTTSDGEKVPAGTLTAREPLLNLGLASTLVTINEPSIPATVTEQLSNLRAINLQEQG